MKIIAKCTRFATWSTGIIGNMPGLLPLEVQERLVRRSRGRSGINIDYVVNTVRRLRECGIFDRRLEALIIRLGQHRRLDGFRPSRTFKLRWRATKS